MKDSADSAVKAQCWSLGDELVYVRAWPMTADSVRVFGPLRRSAAEALVRDLAVQDGWERIDIHPA